MTGTVETIEAERGLLVIKDEDGRMYEFTIDPKTKFRADKKTELRGKKGINLADFLEGQFVRVTYQPEGSRVTEVQLKYKKVKRASRS